jgi:hypothetical protein
MCHILWSEKTGSRPSTLALCRKNAPHCRKNALLTRPSSRHHVALPARRVKQDTYDAGTGRARRRYYLARWVLVESLDFVVDTATENDIVRLVGQRL